MRIVLFDADVDGHHLEYGAYLATYLAEQGDDVRFLTVRAATGRAAFSGILHHAAVEYIPRSRFRGSQNRGTRLLARHFLLKWAASIASQSEADILHHLFLDGSEMPWCATIPRSQYRGFRTFGTLFGLRHVAVMGAASTPAARLAARVKGRFLRKAVVAGRLDGLFVHSRRTSAALVDLLGDEWEESITLVPDPAPSPTLYGRDAARRNLGLPHDVPILLFFGGLRSDKSIDLLLRALQFTSRELAVVIAGEPYSYSPAQLSTLANEPMGSKRLILRLGFVRDADVDSYFASADVVILPYHPTFAGTSGVLAHAAGAGRPVIVTDVGDIGHTTRSYDLGLVVKPESPRLLAAAIESFLDHRHELARRAAAGGARYAASHNGSQLGHAVRNTYLAALGQTASCVDQARFLSPDA